MFAFSIITSLNRKNMPAIKQLSLLQQFNMGTTSSSTNKDQQLHHQDKPNPMKTLSSTSPLSQVPSKRGFQNYTESTNKIPEKVKVSTHHHPLYLVNVDNGWACSGMQLPGGCESGITRFFQTKGMQRYTCGVDDYDLCVKCLQKYLVKQYQLDAIYDHNCQK
eukprot:TRINITY_DN12511_c0_g1_i4.p1 TRINITY_DN12511_c0_g1~~TRINITY_DN12511_c0_g1_i4.p1  ORF type:complete len:163 (+),score=0.08 TRINITY_DN12511_c0_g1_i4:120-608(+)